jgi:DNA polymerase-3 subunit delta'
MIGRSWPICGHQRVTALLSGEIRDRRVRHAYLISGPPMIGKTTLANAFAAALICGESEADGVACGECDDCRRAARGTHPDIQRFSLETQRQQSKDRASSDSLTVDTVREIASVSALRAYSSRFRVIILEDADALTDVAQEALLKTLEEPPPQLVLLLLASRADSLLPTIRSRCELIALSPVAAGVLAECLTGAGLSGDDAAKLAEISLGRPGWAFRAIEDNTLIQERVDAHERIGEWVEATPFDRIVRAFELANDFSRSRESVFAELGSAAEYWRTVMMNAANAAGGGASTATLGESYRALLSVAQCVNDLERNVRPRLALEAMVMKWPATSPAAVSPR